MVSPACAMIDGVNDLRKVDCVGGECATAGGAGFVGGGGAGAGNGGAGDHSEPLGDAGTPEKGGHAGDEGPASGTGDASSDGGSLDAESNTRPDGLNPTDACADLSAPPADGIFVSSDGDDEEGSAGDCGATPGRACRTVMAGIRAAQMRGRTTVYIASGTYEEQISLAPHLSVRGGFRIEGEVWRYDCSPHPERAVVLQAPTNANKTIIADNIGGGAELSTVTVRSKATADPSESLYGVFATGSTTQLVLQKVVVEVANGGDGRPGARGADAAAAASAGSCSSGDGLAGTPGGATGAGGPAGTLSSAGYLPAAGASGGTGTKGHDGAGAPPPTPIAYTTCSQFGPCNQTELACKGSTGTNGCGGEGGGGGQGGTGGGSSIALFVAGAQVALRGGSYASGSGGRGAMGGAGGKGAAGSTGTQGATATCTEARRCLGLSCYPDSDVVASGSLGGTGGSGSEGGPGGGGSGGNSYAILIGDSGAVTYLEPPTLGTGAAGTSLSNGASGIAATLWNF